MAKINLPERVRQTLKTIDASQLYGLIQQCLDQEQTMPLMPLVLFNAGDYVSSKLRYFEKAMIAYRAAKAHKKRADTLSNATSAGSDLIYSVHAMQSRVQQDEEDAQRFYVNDSITPPSQFHEKLSCHVRYRWREKAADRWTHGTIAFFYNVNMTPHNATALLKSKLSASQKECLRQEKLGDQWEYLTRSCLWSVRDFFKDGGNGANIPEIFHVKTDTYTGELNNHSAKFWLNLD